MIPREAADESFGSRSRSLAEASETSTTASSNASSFFVAGMRYPLIFRTN